MIPLRDNIQADRTPWVNYAILGICAVVFLLQLKESNSEAAQRGHGLVERFGMIPERVFNPHEPIVQKLPVRQFGGYVLRDVELAEPPFSAWLTLLTCVFLHGGWLHFLGNMWILYIFGDNVEDRLGHWGYVAFYLGSGVAASAAHLFVNSDSPIPTIGASGAIAGVMGAYFILFPRARVTTLIPIFYFIEIMVLPASVFLGFWFLLQFFQGAASISAVNSGGVAWWAHIGGFAVGVAVILILRITKMMPDRKVVVIPTQRGGFGGQQFRRNRGRRHW